MNISDTFTHSDYRLLKSHFGKVPTAQSAQAPRARHELHNATPTAEISENKPVKSAQGSGRNRIRYAGSDQPGEPDTPPEYPTPIEIPDPTEIPSPVPGDAPTELPGPQENPAPEIEPPKEQLSRLAKLLSVHERQLLNRKRLLEYQDQSPEKDKEPLPDIPTAGDTAQDTARNCKTETREAKHVLHIRIPQANARRTFLIRFLPSQQNHRGRRGNLRSV